HGPPAPGPPRHAGPRAPTPGLSICGGGAIEPLWSERAARRHGSSGAREAQARAPAAAERRREAPGLPRTARAGGITRVQADDPLGWQLVRDVYPHTGGAAIVGFTGPPGAGKSTLISAL